MDMQYQLRAGSYYLYDMRDTPSAVTGERRFKLKTDTVAIAFDVHTGEVHQHGSPTRIQSWATMTRRRLRAAGADVERPSADALVTTQGRYANSDSKLVGLAAPGDRLSVASPRNATAVETSTGLAAAITAGAVAR